MRLYALRGAITVERNDAEEILAATDELMRELTQDLDAEFPAKAARRMGLSAVPLMCAREVPVPGSLPRVIRVLVHYYADDEHASRHVYLRDARSLRADLESAQ
jgi:chorismate mutase